MTGNDVSGRPTYPEELGPPGMEKVVLPGVERPLLITGFTPRFERWSESLHGPLPTRLNDVGETVMADYGGKPFLWVDGEPKFAELAIVRAFQKLGWDGVWVHSPSAGRYMNDWPLDKGRVDALPEQAAEIMEIFTGIAGGAGCPDVFVWSEDDFMFLESKQKDEKYTNHQKNWMKALLGAGLPRDDLGRTVAVVRWTPQRARPHD